MDFADLLTRRYCLSTLLLPGAAFCAGLALVAVFGCLDRTGSLDPQPKYWPLLTYAAVMVALLPTLPHERIE